MNRKISAVFAAAALAGVSGFASAASGSYPFSVTDAGPVLTPQQQEYMEQSQAQREAARGVAGRAGPAMESEQESHAFAEVQTPSRGGPIDD